MSAISITPAFNVWMPSPDSGTSTSTVDSAVRATSSSVWPTPTVSIRIRSNPNASRRSATSSVVVARPPCAPRVAMDRMNTPGSRPADSIRLRPPSNAPPVKGLVGSTATTPTPSCRARNRWISRSVSVLLPAPGGPVTPMRRDAPRPRPACTWDSRRSNPSRWFSTRLIALAADAPSYGLVVLGVFVSGLGIAAYHPEAAKFAAYVSGRRRTSGMSLFSIGGNMGYAVGPIVTALLVHWLGLAGGLLLAVPCVLVGVVLVAVTRYLGSFLPDRRATALRSGNDQPGAVALLLSVIAFRNVAWF